ncbi:lim domain containing protein [Moniliophthora roreri MCA 2997]|uniref:Lim domain containing protein n=1 Tax=Moniliophthora roreri (strain MCA 2997) TaxID=1381753 RepID=V2X804_MONRO|nr:lim domain containing protein [Moniliophthora roreri MCA 2997]
MALAPPSEPQGRISQLLPTVKCSNCNNPVPLAQLGEHQCPAPPPLPDLPKPSVSSSQATSLLPQRLQRLVSPSSPPPPSPSSSSNDFLPARNSSDSFRGSTSASGPRRSHAPSISTLRTRSTSSASSTLERISSPPRPSFSSPRDSSTSTLTSASASASSSPSPSSSPFAPLHATRPSFASSTPSNRDHFARPPPTHTAQPSHSSTKQVPPSPRRLPPMHHTNPSHASIMSSAPMAIPIPSSTPVPHPLSISTPRSPEPDTVTGGEAGMAGVGRRGFAAAAQAALFVVPLQSSPNLHPNVPQFLDMAAVQRVNGTPPLTSGSYSSDFSSVSSPLSPRTPDALTPGARPVDRNKIPQGRTSPKTHVTPGSPPREPSSSRRKSTSSIGSESEYGLAYADSTDYEDHDEDMKELMRRSNSARMSRSSSRKSQKGKEAAPPIPALPSTHHSKNSASISSQKTVDGKENANMFSASPSPDEEKQWSFTLRDEGFSPTTTRFPSTPASPPASKGAPLRSNTVQGLGGYTSPKIETPKLPARANTERGSTEKGVERKKRSKTCVRCEKRIEDGKWIQVDGGSVLCERCWKNMYLPKCRRCNLPIEKHAVSSSDGQLKGKYHKDCFNCHTCHKPFPNKTFYVYEGKPFCAYHYHEANRSLCTATTCGQPIEGPCAVSHTGARYHPEHMLCEYPGARACKERLTEYWEIDGLMLCEEHAKRASQGVFGLYGYGDDDDDLSHYGDDDEEVDGSWEDRKALKRVTRFIDLGLGGGSGIGGSDLR